ncbi:MAG TPA: class I SAM-dependent methyltransferase [Acidimicrobiales bacterium]|nr:class I SAM-dependent methyltransferase [Acidimicrobiales bacterium]
MSVTQRDRRTLDDRHFDRWSRRNDRSPLQSLLFGPVQRTVVASLAPRLPPSGVVLDVGCGTGRLLGRLGDVLPSSTLVGLDRSASMAETARRIRAELRIERGSAEALPHRDSCFDAVITTISFHHWSDKLVALQEVCRVLRPGGLLALTDLSIDDVPAPLRPLANQRMRDMPTLLEREQLIEEAGLEVLDAFPTLHRRWITLTLAERPRA